MQGKDRVELLKLAKKLKDSGDKKGHGLLSSLLSKEKKIPKDAESDEINTDLGLSEKEMNLLEFRLKNEVGARDAQTTE